MDTDVCLACGHKAALWRPAEGVQCPAAFWRSVLSIPAVMLMAGSGRYVANEKRDETTSADKRGCRGCAETEAFTCSKSNLPAVTAGEHGMRICMITACLTDGICDMLNAVA